MANYADDCDEAVKLIETIRKAYIRYGDLMIEASKDSKHPLYIPAMHCGYNFISANEKFRDMIGSLSDVVENDNIMHLVRSLKWNAMSDVERVAALGKAWKNKV